MKFLSLICFFFFSFFMQAQTVQMIEYDCISKKMDTIKIISQNLKFSDNTTFYVGNLDSKFAYLDTETPTENLTEESEFTLKSLTHNHYDLNHFPIRTSIRLNKVENDSIFSSCSGSMVGPDLVLTAAHCISSNFNVNPHFFDNNYYCSPIIDNGIYNDNLYGSRVSKIYIPLIDGKIYDIALLKLHEPIGLISGWLGFGFQEDDSKLKDEIFYKFSYPSKSNFFGNKIDYNGDTLYFNYGRLDFFSNIAIGVNKGKGIPGESGSSLFSVKNKKSYITYGAFSTAGRYTHTRITKSIFKAFKYYLEKANLQEYKNELNFYPNPVINNLFLYSISKQDFKGYKIYNLQGHCLISSKYYDDINGISLAELSQGVYILECEISNKKVSKKIIKM